MLRILVVALAAVFFSTSASYARDWVRLGDRHVGFISDHDTIHVGVQDGRFKRLKLGIHGNDIKLDSVKILFGNGEIENVVFDQRIPDGGSAVINLRTAWHEGRFIRDVELHYRSRPDFRGEAVAELWGQED